MKPRSRPPDIVSADSLRRLHKPDDVVVCVLYGGNQFTAADVLHVLMRLSAGVQKRLQTLRDVGDFPVRDGARVSLLVAVGIEAYFLVSDPEANIVGLVHIGLYAQELAEQRLRLR